MTDQIPPDEVQIPREQLPIPFFGRAVLAARRQDGQIYLSIRDMCEAMDLAFSAQRRRIVSTERLRAAMVQFRVRTPGGRQSLNWKSFRSGCSAYSYDVFLKRCARG